MQKTNNPLFSIITVCKNSEKTISRTIESVLNQTYKDFEYIIVDGLSTDNTINIITSYKDPRIKLISEHDTGIYNAMNKGIKKSVGKLIGIINSDDFYEKHALETIVKYYNSSYKYQVMYGALRIFYNNGLEKSIVLNNINSINEQSIMHPSSFVSRTIYNDIKTYDEKYISSSDYDFFVFLSQKNYVHFVCIDCVLANFTEGGMSSSSIGEYEVINIKYKYHIINNTNRIAMIAKAKINNFLKKVNLF